MAAEQQSFVLTCSVTATQEVNSGRQFAQKKNWFAQTVPPVLCCIHDVKGTLLHQHVSCLRVLDYSLSRCIDNNIQWTALNLAHSNSIWFDSIESNAIGWDSIQSISIQSYRFECHQIGFQSNSWHSFNARSIQSNGIGWPDGQSTSRTQAEKVDYMMKHLECLDRHITKYEQAIEDQLE